jgi:hypothetical protein
MGYADKCTWMTYAKLHNPTFILGKGTKAAGTDSLGIFAGASQTWILHHMEYNDEQIPMNATTGYIITNK